MGESEKVEGRGMSPLFLCLSPCLPAEGDGSALCFGYAEPELDKAFPELDSEPFGFILVLKADMRDLVLGWWLTFAQAGLAPARIDKLSWRTKQQLQYVKRR